MVICHSCGAELFEKEIIALENAPSAAQRFLASLDEEDNSITLSIYKCKRCGLLQHKNIPVSYYKNVITAAGISEATREFRKNKLQYLINKYNLVNKKTLEIGSANGEMLDLLKELNLDVTGLEYNTQNKNIINNYILDFNTQDKFDFIVSYNYLEHLPKLNLVLEKIHSLLSDEGIGYFTVPNIDYLLKTESYYEFIIDHISYFSKDTLVFAFQNKGFVVLECEIINNENDIIIVVRKNRNLDLSSGMKNIEKLIGKFRQILLNYNKVAIFGAGHRTLTLLSMGNLNNFSYIVDSCSFKQNKFSPLTHIKIVNPQHLLEEKVNALIIAVPGIFPKDVIKLIDSMNIKTDIYLLKDNDLILRGG